MILSVEKKSFVCVYYIMRCPFCKQDDDKVVDSRSGEGGQIIRRRRECLSCQRRFTTYERVEEIIKLTVVKKDGSRVPYNRSKIEEGIRKSCYKRPVSEDDISVVAEAVEDDLLHLNSVEVTSSVIGKTTMKRLKTLDKVAYIRFASVYQEFEQVGQFIQEINEVMQPDGE